MSQKTRFIIYGIVAVILTATYFIKESKTIIRLPVIGKIPAFSFIDSHGDEINRRNLDGKVWVADFIFTTCTMACPVMTGNMNIIHIKNFGIIMMLELCQYQFIRNMIHQKC
jgi:cytochrome oxidase Cu insertion factor (SCO1/SenC/PrrC family)